MHMWGGYWGMPWSGFDWLRPLVGLVVMAFIALACFRRMGGCMTGDSHHADGAVERLRQEVRELRDEIRQLRERS